MVILEGVEVANLFPDSPSELELRKKFSSDDIVSNGTSLSHVMELFSSRR